MNTPDNRPPEPRQIDRHAPDAGGKPPEKLPDGGGDDKDLGEDEAPPE